MKIFHKYLIKRSLFISLFVLILFVLLDMVFSLMSELENISDEYNFIAILKYIVFSSPQNAINFLEGACLLGVMISLGISHQEGNLNVLRSSGQSPIKIIITSAIGPMLIVFLYLFANEYYFNDINSGAKLERAIKVGKTKDNAMKNDWLKDSNSFLSYTNLSNSTIYNVKFIKTDDSQVLYYKTAYSAQVEEGRLIFDETLKTHTYKNNTIINNVERFDFPLVAKIPYKNIEDLSIYEITKTKKVLSESNIIEDRLFLSHIDKSYYKKLFQPFSILSVIIFFGAFIFGSLRSASPASRIVLSVVGAFLYKIIQDFSISLAIATNFSVFIGVIAPAVFLSLASLFLYKRI